MPKVYVVRREATDYVSEEVAEEIKKVLGESNETIRVYYIIREDLDKLSEKANKELKNLRALIEQAGIQDVAIR